MSQRRTKLELRIVFGVSVLSLALVLYVLSIGPALWVNRNVNLPNAYNEGCALFYTPIAMTYHNGPQWFRDVMDWYADWWGIR